MNSLDENIKYYPLGEFCKEAGCGPINVINYNLERGRLNNILIQTRICQKFCLANKLYQYQQGKEVEPIENINS